MGRPKIYTEEERKQRRRETRLRYDNAHRTEKAAYREANKESIKKHDAAYRSANKERLAAANAASRGRRLEAKAEYDRLYRERNKARIIKRRVDNREQTAAYMREWRKNHKESLKQYNVGWQETHKEQRQAYQARYNALKPNRGDPCRKQARTMYRRATKIQATPRWFGELDAFIMLEAAALCKTRAKATGIKWHIDHIVPLVSKKVCGLHVGCNIAVIPAKENQAKHNRHWPDVW